MYVCVCVYVLVQQRSMQSATKCMNKQDLDLNRATESRAEPTNIRATPAEVAATEWYFMRHLLNLKSKALVQLPPLLHHPPLSRIVSYKSMRINVCRLQRKCSNYFDLSPPHTHTHVGFSNCNFPRVQIPIGTIENYDIRQM